MSYLKKTLSDGEVVLGEARFHWSYMLGAWLILLAGIAASVLIWQWIPVTSPYRPLAWVVAGVCLLIFLKLVIDKRTTEIAVTNYRFLYKRGWIARTTQELPMRRVEQVDLDQTVLGRLFGYGRLRVCGTGGDRPIVVPNVDDPLALRKALVDASNRAAPAVASSPPAQRDGAP